MIKPVNHQMASPLESGGGSERAWGTKKNPRKMIGKMPDFFAQNRARLSRI